MIISLLIGMISTVIILQKYFHFVAIESYHQQINMIDNCKSGMNLLKYDSKYRNNQNSLIDLYQNEEDSVLLIHKDWGGLSVFSSQAFYKGDTLSKSGLMGVNLAMQNKYCLYLTDHNKPLSLCGKTCIEGTAFLPEAGVKRAYIEGRSYVGDEMIYGTMEISESKLPKLNEKWLSQIENFINQSYPFETDEILFSDLENDLTIDFSDQTTVLHSNDSICIDNFDLQGNIIVSSSDAVYVKNNTSLENVVLVAPRIYLQSSTSFQGQLLASESIIINENCNLEFPSVVAAVGNNVNININSGSTINGVTILIAKNEGILSIENNSTIIGEVYNDGYTQLTGEINGSLITNKFYLRTASSAYENHILNGVISNKNFTKEYFGLHWQGQNSEWIELVDVQ